MIAIIDYGMGNSGSIQNMFKRIGRESVITSDIETITSAERLVLPGVGAFDNAMINLEEKGLVSLLNTLVLEWKKPILGICLGMQLLSKRSDEGTLDGLGWVDAETVAFRGNPSMAGLPIPHMGWNTVRIRQKGSPLDNIDDSPKFYFVHSYYVKCRNDNNVLATSEYGITFCSALISNNIVGTQFHPEKSHRFGLRLLKNFAQG